MRIINLDRNIPRRRVTSMVYGPSRAGKTRLAATYPRPLFLSDSSEGGWETIRYMEKEAFYEPERTPAVWAMEGPSDMIKSLALVAQSLTSPVVVEGKTYRPGDIQTVVIDSLTFYADSFLAAMETVGKKDPRQVYQALAAHLRAVMIDVHNLPVNVVWTCLEKGPDEDNQSGGILLAGQSRDKAPARCDFWHYCRSFQRGPTSPVEYEVRTRRFGVWPAGGRDGGLLPDPLPDASYRSMVEALELMPNALEPELEPVSTSHRNPVASATGTNATPTSGNGSSPSGQVRRAVPSVRPAPGR